MIRRCIKWVGVAAVLCAWAASAAASGVFIVSRAGVTAYNDAKAGFIQMAYSLQLPGFNPKVIDLAGTAADEAALAGLKAQNPSLVYAIGAYAARKVREAVPEAWVVYGMVYYPEAEGFTDDPRMVGIVSLGPPKALATMVKALGGKGKGIVILHSESISKAIPTIISRLNSEGFEAQARSMGSAGDMEAAFNSVKDQFRVILLLPDPITSNQDALRFLISQCAAAKILPVSLTEGLVAEGVLCASFYPADAVGNQAARVAQSVLASSKAPAERLIVPLEFKTALNKGTASALGVTVPKTLNVELTYE